MPAFVKQDAVKKSRVSTPGVRCTSGANSWKKGQESLFLSWKKDKYYVEEKNRWLYHNLRPLFEIEVFAKKVLFKKELVS